MYTCAKLNRESTICNRQSSMYDMFAPRERLNRGVAAAAGAAAAASAAASAAAVAAAVAAATATASAVQVNMLILLLLGPSQEVYVTCQHHFPRGETNVLSHVDT
jgi:hypothetical protein